MKNNLCPVCNSSSTRLFLEVKEYTYNKCNSCDVIFLDTEILDEIDKGKGLIEYTYSYWNEELKAANERSWGTSLARVAELFLYAQRPIQKFIDIGSGPGYLLDAISYQLPSASDIFYAHELFPPADEFCTKNENYQRGGLETFSFNFDAGTCIEVIEHLTPKMVKGLFEDLAKKSTNNSIYIFNTGLVEYIEKEDLGYLDPHKRGHIMGWSIKSLQLLVSSLGFQILPLRGKTWAFIAEFNPTHNINKQMPDRLWHMLPENKLTLRDNKTGELMYILGLETARAYS